MDGNFRLNPGGPVAQYNDSFCRADGFRKIMSDQDGCFPGGTYNAADISRYGQARLVIQGAEGFVKQQYFRLPKPGCAPVRPAAFSPESSLGFL